MKGFPANVYFLEALRTYVFIYSILNSHMQAMQQRNLQDV